MSHFTLQSGVPTITVSLYCPTCRQRRVFDADRWRNLQRSMYVRVQWLYCSEACRLQGVQRRMRQQSDAQVARHHGV